MIATISVFLSPSNHLPMSTLFRFCFSLTLVSLLFFSCDKERTILPVPDGSSFVKEHNLHLPKGLSIRHAFEAEGEIPATAFLVEEGHDFRTLSFTFKGSNGVEEIYRKFNVGVSNDFSFPAKIDNAKIIYLESRIFVANLDDNSFYSFVVPIPGNTENLFPDYEYFTSVTIGTETITPDLLKVANACKCGCVVCSNDNPRNPCTTIQCSCSCDGDSCSRTCYNGYNAICQKNCNGDQ